MKALYILFIIFLVSIASLGQQAPLLSNEFVGLPGVSVQSTSIDENDNILMSGLGRDNKPQIRLTSPSGNEIWKLTFKEDLNYPFVNSTIIGDRAYCLATDSIYTISINGSLISTLPKPKNGKARIFSMNGKLIYLPYRSTVAQEQIFILDKNLNVITTIDTGYIGKSEGFSAGLNSDFYVASLRQDGVGINTNSASEFLKSDGSTIKWRKLMPDLFTPSITFSNGRLYFSATGFVTYNELGAVKEAWFFGELNVDNGEVIWQKTWTLPWYPSNVPADAWALKISVNKPEGFIISGCVTMKGMDSTNFNRNRFWLINTAFNGNGDSLWTVITERFGESKGALWGKNNHLFLYGNCLGQTITEGKVQVFTIPGVTSVEQIDETPQSFSLAQNYPNPFNPSTTIRFSIPVSENVTLKVYDLMGQEITTLVDGFLSAGTHEVEFTGSNLASGTYFYVLASGNYREVKKMVLLK